MRTLPLAVALLSSSATAQLTLHPLFGDHMVWPRGRSVTVHGLGLPSDTIEVRLRKHRVQARADERGVFRVVLPAVDVGAPTELIVTGSRSGKRTCRDVVVGDVWLCSGQSNMVWPLSRSNNSKTEIEAASVPMLRLFKVDRQVATLPLASPTSGRWSRCAPASVAGFSAVAYYFGRKLTRELKVPIGVVQSAVGGTPVEAWMSPHVLAGEAFGMVHQRRQAAEARYRQRMRKAVEASSPRRRGMRPPNPTHRPTALFCGMIAPLQSMPFRGVIWYQGEANVRRAFEYRKLFPAMIQDWRRQLGAPDLPFLFAQVAPFNYRGQPATALAELWESQMAALLLPKTAMATTMDVGNLRDIHPRRKQPVGERLAQSALALEYGMKVRHQAPAIQSVQFEKRKALVTCRHANSGWTVLGEMDRGVAEFALAGTDRTFHPAMVKILADGRLEVSSDKVAEPVALRHAWRSTAKVTLLRKGDNCPLLPYRSDSWPAATQRKSVR